MTTDVLLSIDVASLDAVTGGRMDPGPETVDPKVLQSVQTLAQSVQQLGPSLAQAKEANQQGMMQMAQQMMQARGGGGGGH